MPSFAESAGLLPFLEESKERGIKLTPLKLSRYKIEQLRYGYTLNTGVPKSWLGLFPNPPMEGAKGSSL